MRQHSLKQQLFVWKDCALDPFNFGLTNHSIWCSSRFISRIEEPPLWFIMWPQVIFTVAVEYPSYSTQMKDNVAPATNACVCHHCYESRLHLQRQPFLAMIQLFEHFWGNFVVGRLYIFPCDGSPPGCKWQLSGGYQPEMANVTANVWIAALAEVGWWKHEQNCRCINMFVFVHFMWYDTWEQPRHVRIGSRSCNLMLLGQMLPRALTTNPVSESGNVVAAFLMFWSDAARMVAASIVLFPGMHLNLSRSHSHDLMIFSLKKKTTYMEGSVLSHKVHVSSLSSAWFQTATLCGTSPMRRWSALCTHVFG